MADPMSSDSADLGPVTGASDPAMAVVTAVSDTELAGCLAGFHTQCSIDPPRYVVAVSKANHTYAVALRCESLGVSILSESRRDLAELFGAETADDGIDKFDHCAWDAGPRGVPIIRGASASLVGAIVDRVDVGDHVLHVLDPVEVSGSPLGPSPLRYHDTASIDPGHPG